MQRKILIIGMVFLAMIVCSFALWKSEPQYDVSETNTPALQDGYTVNDGKVFYVILSPQRNEFELKEADAATFVPFDNGWGKDATHVYYNGYTTHPASTSVPTIHTSTFTSIPDTFYAKDDQAVYFPSFISNPDGTGSYEYNIFPKVDPSTFVIVKPLLYAKDKNYVWDIRQGEGGPVREVIVGADPANCTAENLQGCEASQI